MKVAFIDRDGVINEDFGHVHQKSDWVYTKKCVVALLNLSRAGFEIVVVTNQAGIAKGYYSEKQYQELTSWYRNDLKRKGVFIHSVLHCPHHPEGVVARYATACDCRKPAPGLINRFISENHVDIDRSILIGDKYTDLQAGKASGIGRLYLVKTGHGASEKNAVKSIASAVFEDLYAASEVLSP